MPKLYPQTFISDPHKGTIYVLELARRGCRKINASAMPEVVEAWMTGAEATGRRIAYAKVPLAIRRAAKAHLGVS